MLFNSIKICLGLLVGNNLANGPSNTAIVDVNQNPVLPEQKAYFKRLIKSVTDSGAVCCFVLWSGPISAFACMCPQPPDIRR